MAAVQLSHFGYTLLCIISQQMTSINSLQAQISAYQGSGLQPGGAKYKHNDQLEELRNLQDKLNVEKEAWSREKLLQESDLKESKAELLALQEQIKSEQEDIKQQREQLYRKMEVLSNKGLLLSPSVTLPAPSGAAASSGSPEEIHQSPNTSGSSQSVSDNDHHNTAARKDSKWKSAPAKPSLPINLISATNQPKVQQTVKQQLPMKLSRLGTLSSAAGAPAPAPPVGGTGVQQMLPLKLSQNLAMAGAADGGPRRASGAAPAGYQRLSSGSFSPPSADNPPVVGGHARTGSSPAMMQATPSNSQQPVGSYTPTHSTGNKPGRTNTYPKIPDKFRIRSPQESPPAEEEVIFF